MLPPSLSSEKRFSTNMLTRITTISKREMAAATERSFCTRICRSIKSPIMEFSVPMLIGNFAQQLYNTADSVIVGKFVGDNALSAVGSASPILNLLLALFVGISTGAGILVSQYFGAHRQKELETTLSGRMPGVLKQQEKR